ncbi:MAG: polyprenyl synthetase family protein [Clostridiales bacterium]|nr:polyprenyl synthetase family protein [Clostridiales bacterium]
MDFEKVLNEKIELINEGLKNYLKPKYPPLIYQAPRDRGFAGATRLRPLLLPGACEAVGGNPADALGFACAIEMIHTYTLIHDDLPAMDNDDFRRGKPTCHKAFSEDIAILAGDGLLNLGFETMLSEAVSRGDLKYTKAALTIGELCGVRGTIGGQVVDLLSEEKKADEETLLYIHKTKTAALIQAALKAGAVIGGADSETLSALDEIGYKMGIAFQIKDDILDITSTTEVLGKPVGSDDKNGKSTYVSVFGFERANEDYLRLSEEVCGLLEKFGEKGAFLCEYAKRLINRVN